MNEMYSEQNPDLQSHLNIMTNYNVGPVYKILAALEYLSSKGDTRVLPKDILNMTNKINRNDKNNMDITYNLFKEIVPDKDQCESLDVISNIIQNYTDRKCEDPLISILILEQLEFIISKIKDKFIYEYESKTNKLYRSINKIHSLSKGERLCMNALGEIFPGKSFIKIRHPKIINPLTKRPLELDLYNEELELAVEYNGKQHYDHIPYFHQSEQDLKSQQERDSFKVISCKEHDITLIVVPYKCDTKNKVSNFIKQSLGYNISDIQSNNSIEPVLENTVNKPVSNNINPKLQTIQLVHAVNTFPLSLSELKNDIKPSLSRENKLGYPCAINKSPDRRHGLSDFIKYHITADLKEMISMRNFAEKYKNYCDACGTIYGYKDGDLVTLGRDIASINTGMKTTRKRPKDNPKGNPISHIVGYKFINLDIMGRISEAELTVDPVTIKPMSVKRDCSITINPNEVNTIIEANKIKPMIELTTIDPVVAAAEFIKAIEAEETRYKFLAEIYERLQEPELNGAQFDMNPTIPSVSTMTENSDKYTLVIKANLGLSQTGEICKELMKGPNVRILIVYANISLIEEQLNDLRTLGFRSYSDIKTLIIRDRLSIVTVDLAHRIQSNYDYLILDEFTMTLAQMVEFNNNHTDQNCNALIEKIKCTPKVIITDSLITDSSIDILRRYRDDVMVYENRFQKHTMKTVNVINEYPIAYQCIFDDVKKRLKLAIAFGDKDTGKAVANATTKYQNVKIYKGNEQPGLNDGQFYKVKYYMADEKYETDPVTEWHLFDCVIYTGAIKAGNSFTLEHFDKFYGLFTAKSFGKQIEHSFTGRSCASFGPDVAAQMTLTVGTTKSNEINICVKGKYNEFPQYVKTKRDLDIYIKNKDKTARDSLFNIIPMSYCNEPIDYNHPYYQIHLDVKYRGMIGKRNYIPKLLSYLKMQGVKFGREIDFEEIVRNANKDVKLESCGEYAIAADINEEKHTTQ
ncbi:Hypothetical protein HVR_LOCUS1044 [uncultured virus]|nr:Hypothetical protein HVR_LOCUS1044 [uncultured virus]